MWRARGTTPNTALFLLNLRPASMLNVQDEKETLNGRKKLFISQHIQVLELSVKKETKQKKRG